MLTKTEVINSFQELPEKVTAEQLIERIIFLNKIDIGLKQYANGETFSNDEVLADLQKWRKQE
jgi:predicted transcriptional regulator